MRKMRSIGGAIVLAGMMAAGLGTATLEAKKPGGGGGGAAICAYLKAIIDYPYTSPSVREWAMSLYVSYGCAG